MGGPGGYLAFEFLAYAEEGTDVVEPCGLVWVVEEGVDDAVSNAAEGDLGEVVVPALFFVAEALRVLSELQLLGGQMRMAAAIAQDPATVVGRARVCIHRNRRRWGREQVRIFAQADFGLGEGKLYAEFALGLEARPVKALLETAGFAAC
jgi:hypothetical protein